MHFRKVTLVGVGLLGGSLGLALRRRGLADEVQGFVRRASSVAECLALGVVDRCSRSLVEAVTDADLVAAVVSDCRVTAVAEEGGGGKRKK